VRDPVELHVQVGRDHPVGVERQRLAPPVGQHHLDPVDGAVLEAGDQPGALADVGGRHPAPDQRVDQRRLAGFDASGDGDLKRRGQPAQHLVEAGRGALADLRLEPFAQLGDCARQRTR
jgi:hypothetical protein